MIYQEMPRKNCWAYPPHEPDKGFYIEGKNFDDCITQLKDWCKNHPEKWVYYCNCGVGPAKDFPIARNVIDVVISDSKIELKRSTFMGLYYISPITLFQKGKE